MNKKLKIKLQRMVAKKVALAVVGLPIAMLITAAVKLDSHFEDRIDEYFDGLSDDQN